jgi:hypothetical protein
MDEQVRKDVTKPHRKKFFKVENLNDKLYGGKTPPLSEPFWQKSRQTSDVVAGKQVKDAKSKGRK